MGRSFDQPMPQQNGASQLLSARDRSLTGGAGGVGQIDDIIRNFNPLLRNGGATPGASPGGQLNTQPLLTQDQLGQLRNAALMGTPNPLGNAGPAMGSYQANPGGVPTIADLVRAVGARRF